MAWRERVVSAPLAHGSARELTRAAVNSTAKADVVPVVEKIREWLCFLAILFASGDLWPTVTIGFNFRFSQLCMLAALAISPGLLLRDGVRLFPGWSALYLFAIWLFATLPFSLFVTRSIGYTFWAVTDVLIIFIFVQTFRTETALVRLVSYFLQSFVLLALFGMVQFGLGLFGVGVLVSQWWIPDVLPRINGISYEPSFYATYLVCGWVLSCYLLERGVDVPSRRLLKVCAFTTTIALLLATSRLGWAMMLLWGLFRAAERAFLIFTGRRMRTRSAAMFLASPLVIAALLVFSGPWSQSVLRAASEASFLFSGVGLLGAPSHSVAIRAGDVQETWNAFAAHPLTGTGIGAVPAEIAAARGNRILTLEDAKPNEGMSIFVEILASTGIVGLALLTAFAVAVVRGCVKTARWAPPWRVELLRGVGWSVIWVLLALQFSQNLLRVWFFIDIAVLICCLTASPQRAPAVVPGAVRPPVRSTFSQRPISRPASTNR